MYFDSKGDIKKCPPFEQFPDVTWVPIRYEGTKHGYRSHLSIDPSEIFPKIASRLGLLPLDDDRLCVRGEPLTNVVLPKPLHLQAQMLIGIVIWLRPCLRIPMGRIRTHCFMARRRGLENLDWSKIKTLHGLLLNLLLVF